MNIMKKSKSVRLPSSGTGAGTGAGTGTGADSTPHAPIAQAPITSLKKSKSVRVKSTLKAIANPVKSREDKKATKSDLELKEREEADKNVDDFLTSGRKFYEKQSSRP